LQVSCIIPTRDRCRMVLKALDSIAKQQWHDLEVIVVDDGSSDNTCPEISAFFPNVQLLRLDGVGPGLARNAGADAALGDYLMFLDSDDLWFDGHVVMLMEVLNRGFEVAYGTTSTIDQINDTQFLIPENGAGPEGDCFKEMLRWCFMVPSATAVSRKAFQNVGGFGNEWYGEDWTFFTRLAARYPFGFAGPQPITLRRLHSGSLCFLTDRQKPLAIIRQMRTVLKNEPKVTDADQRRFIMIEEWTSRNDGRWSTIQEWYQSMLQENII
jgi:glycosyltransferase involved in cell wall biosynthesis